MAAGPDDWSYRPNKMKTPAAIARNGRITPRPLRAEMSETRPIRMSQMANKSMPIFLVKFNFLMEAIPSLSHLVEYERINAIFYL
jgi:hypothetical protein